MGDFDRNEIPVKRNETKKLAVVLGLGVVLVALAAMQLASGGPQAAVGAPVKEGVAPPPPNVSEEISAQALANMMNDLQNDPTKSLLRSGVDIDHTLDAPSRNPFSFSNTWLSELVKPVIEAPQTQVATRPYMTPHPVSTTQPVVLRIEDFKLASIVNGNMAVINGKVVKAGDVVDKARIIDIREEGVILQPADFPNGPTLVLSIQPRFNKE